MQINTIASEIIQLSSNGNFKKAFEMYNGIDHPTICYYLGIYAYNDDYDDLAKRKFIQGAKFGLTYPNEYYNNLHSNAIGQCIYYLLDKNLIRLDNSQKIMELIGLSYIYLSVSVNLIGNKAYQSYESRAKLLSMTQYETEAIGIMHHFGVESIGFPIVIAHDFYQSEMGTSTYLYNMSENEHTRELNSKALLMDVGITKYSGIQLDFEELTNTALKLHEKAFKNAESLLIYANLVKDKNSFFS
jgi:hypothetical protein